MTRYMRLYILAIITACATAAWCAPSGRDPYAAYVYPAGGQQGTVFQVTVGGQRLQGANSAYVSGQGVRVAVVHYVGPLGPLNRLQQEELRRRIEEIIKQRYPGRAQQTRAAQQGKKENDAPAKPVTLPDLPELRDLEKKTTQQLKEIAEMFLNPQKRPKPPMAEEVTLEVTIDPAATPGNRELRLRTPAGMTNPIVFQVGRLPEQCEPRKKEQPLPAQNAPVVLNGQIMPGEVDRFSLQLKRGQQVVATAQARMLTPYLADAVPGWFQAVLALYDANGTEVAFADDYEFNPDPVLAYRAPQDGIYRLEVRDAIYRGRQDFVYRVAIDGQPHLPALPAPAIGEGLPQRGELEPNGTAQQAKPIAFPQLVTGCIAQRDDVDIFRFSGRAGDTVVMEICARRAGSPLDALLRLRDATGRVLAWNDDTEDKGQGLLTHYADPYLTYKLPASGIYSVEVSDAQRHGGEAYRYTLRVGPPQPDFALRMTPSSINVPAGRAVPITIYALRKDGFSGEIEVVLKNAPAGFALSGARIPAGRDSIRMTLAAPSGAVKEPVLLQLEGRSKIDGTTVARPIIPSEEMMQAFAYQHLVPSQQLAVTVTGGGRQARNNRQGPQNAVSSGVRLRIPAGGREEMTFPLPKLPPNTPLTFELCDPPAGISLQDARVTPGRATLVLAADGKLAGYTDNLIIEAFTEVELKGQEGNDKKRRISAGFLPAIPIEVTAQREGVK